MGFDSPALEAAGARQRAAHQAMIDRWDCLLAPSEYFVDTFARSYRYNGPVLRSGSPRNDPLVRPSLDVDALREQLEIPAGSKVVLYAPTFRDRDLRLDKPFELQLDLDAAARRSSATTTTSWSGRTTWTSWALPRRHARIRR